MEEQRTGLSQAEKLVFMVAGVLALCLVFAGGWILISGALYPDALAEETVEDVTPSSIFTPQSIEATNTPEAGTGDEGQTPTSIPIEAITYTVQYGDSLGYIAMEFDVTVEMLMQANNLQDEDILDVGQVLIIPVAGSGEIAPGFLLLPDSELVYSPGNTDFDTAAFIMGQAGYLASFEEEVNGEILSGAEIVQLVAAQNSVNPRLLITALEYQSGWVTTPASQIEYTPFVFGQDDDWRQGLYAQLSWAADRLNLGYYLWRVDGSRFWTMLDGVQVPVNPEINAGTAGIQQLLALLNTEISWREAVGENGIYQTYTEFFGDPFQYAYEPMIPADLVQPDFRLPFEDGVRWTFTGGPHGGWGSGSAWAALDFAPYGDPLGCVQSDAWVLAMADGWIVTSGDGLVIQDLDDDQDDHTGWSILYMHIETRGRVAAGTYVQAGDKIGHPSCEGGYSTGTHVHIARRYNGEWIPADQDLPLVMDGWVSGGYGYLYEGYLQKDGIIVEACECQDIENTVIR